MLSDSDNSGTTLPDGGSGFRQESATDVQPRGVPREGVVMRAASSAAPAPRRRLIPGRTQLNFWLDVTLLLILCGTLYVAAVLQFVLPRGAAEESVRLWGGNVPFWRDLLFWMLALLGFGVLLHLMLHWNWICNVASSILFQKAAGRDEGQQTLLGVGLLVVILHVLAAGLLLARWSLIQAG